MNDSNRLGRIQTDLQRAPKVLYCEGKTDPADDSAGIGAWGLMGLGTLGWNGDDGPNPFSAWSRQALGWARVEEVTTSGPIEVEDVTLRGAMRIVAESHETHFPVIDDEGLVGIFSLTDLRRIFLEEAITDMVIVGDFMADQVATVRLDDSLHDVQRLMTRKQVSAVPVVDAENPRKVLALLERNAIGKAYNEKLAEMKAS